MEIMFWQEKEDNEKLISKRCKMLHGDKYYRGK